MNKSKPDFRIDVNVNAMNKLPTQPGDRTSQTGISGTTKNKVLKTAGFAAVAASGVSTAKTLISADFSITESTMKQRRFNTALQFGQYGAQIAGGFAVGGPVGAGVGVIVSGAQIINQAINYNKDLEKTQIKYNYDIEKYQLNVASGGRYGGGLIW